MIANTARIDHLLQPIVAKLGIDQSSPQRGGRAVSIPVETAGVSVLGRRQTGGAEMRMQIGIARERCSSNENNSAKHLRHLRKASACNTK
jgi:hypothetical protein